VISGTTVYVAYDNSAATTNDRGVISASFDGATFGPSPHALTVVPSNATVLTTVAIADDIFFGDGLSGATKNFYRFGASLASATPVWTSSSIAAVALPPVVSRGLVLGVSTGRLLGFAKSTGATQFTYPAPGAADLTTLSAPATGRDGTLYFTDSANSELVALPPVATPTPIWTFTGPAAALLAGIGTEATLDDNGVLYFGQDSGNVYAIITDGASTPPPAGSGADWPRIGFDRCNSANASYTNCR
jgi:outer membrane protein assembly factor BamB